MIPDAKSRGAAGRWPLIDAARGAALVAMIIYHFAWDLSHYRLIAVDIVRDPFWSLFAKTIAASFLFLVGVGFALGDRGSFDRARYFRRLVIIAAAAALVTLGTTFAVPDAPVLFGILHCIALASVLILPFLRAPLALPFIAAAIAFALPAIFRSTIFDGPWWAWLGLNVTTLPAVDHVPILPWFGFTLLGLGAARTVFERESFARLRDGAAQWRSSSAITRLLIIMGRWSLLIYLTHQLILMAALYPFSLRAPAAPPIAFDDTTNFRSACEQNCRAGGANANACQSFCGCAIDKLKPTPLWAAILRDQVSAIDQSKIAEVTRQCAPAAPKAE